MEKAQYFLSVLGAWIKRTFSEIVSAPGIIWKWSEQSQKNRWIALLGAAAATAMLLAVIVYYIRIIIRKKRETPFTFFFVLALLCAALWFSQDQILKYQVPDTELITVDGEEISVYSQYSLAPGRIMDPDHPNYMNPQWNIADDTISWQIDDDLILQLTGLQSLSSELSYTVTSMEHEGHHCITLNCTTNITLHDCLQTLSADLQIFVFPGRTITEEPWYLESGVDIRAESIFELQGNYGLDGSFWYTTPLTDYHILEKESDRVVFIAYYDTYMKNAICVAQQMGSNLVVGVSRAFANQLDDSSNGSTHCSYDPLEDTDAREFLLEPLTRLFDGRVRLIYDSSGKLDDQILPEKIVGYPVPLCDCEVFILPCSKLVEMRAARYDISIQTYGPLEIRYIGTGPDGQEHFYSLVNGSSVYCNPVADEQIAMLNEWNDAYLDGKASPDTALTELIGIPAIPYEEGWLLKTASYHGGTSEYYYLSVIDELLPNAVANGGGP